MPWTLAFVIEIGIPSDVSFQPLRTRPRPTDALELDAIVRAFLASAGVAVRVLGTV